MGLGNDTASRAWLSACNSVLNGGIQLDSRDGGCLERIGHEFTIDATQGLVRCPGRKLSSAYAAGELLWYLSGSDDVRVMESYAPQYRRFATPGTDTANGAYGKRIGQQWRDCYALLKKQPNTRQALLALWRPEDLESAIKSEHPDYPCTSVIQFLLREGRLHAVVYMRSNDLWLGTPYDVFCFTSMQHLMADCLGAVVGSYTHCVGSLHVYDRNAMKLRKAVRARPGHEIDDHAWSKEVVQPFRPMGLKDCLMIDLAVSEAVSIERALRHGEGACYTRLCEFVQQHGSSTLLSACLIEIAIKFDRGDTASLLNLRHHQFTGL